MATTTITLPNGVKVRSASARRYVLIAPSGTIEKRSDSRDTLIVECSRLVARRGGVTGDYFIADTMSGALRTGYGREID